MTIAEISTVTKLIKEIKFKLNEIERITGKASKEKFTYSPNHQQASHRKRKLYQNPDNNIGKE